MSEPTDPLKAYWRGWRRVARAIVVTLAALGIVVTVAGSAFYASYHETIPDDVRSSGTNALWLRHQWVGEPHTPADYDDLAEMLRDNGITDAFFHVGPLEGDGTIPPERFPYASRLVDAMHERYPGLHVQAWIGQNEAQRGGPLDLDDVAARDRIVATTEVFLAMGFDGIHYNIEPIFPGDERFLDLLDKTRVMTDRYDAVLGTATMELEPFGGAASLGRRVASRYHAWTTDYFEDVAARVDQVAVMTYDSAMPTDWLYGAVVRQQTSELAALIGDETTVFIGIPSYDESNVGHRPGAENVRSGIRGVRLGLADLGDDAPAIGAAIYAEWTTNADEWATWRRDWLRQPD